MKQRKGTKQLLIVFTILLAMVLQACSSNSGGGNNTPAATKAPEASTKPAATEAVEELKPYEVSITYWGTPERDVALVEEKLNEFFKEKINATVKLNPIASSEYKQKTELMMNSGEKMDLVFTASWLDFFSNITKGAFIELDELLEQHGQGIKEQLNPMYLEAPRLDGKLYAVPTNKEITQSRSLTFRKDIIEKYNIPLDTIKTYADITPWMQVIKENEPDIIPNYSAGGGGDGSMYESDGRFLPVGPTPGKIAMFFFNPTQEKIEVINALNPEIVTINNNANELARSWFELGYTNSDAATAKTNISELRKEGKTWFQDGVWKPGAEIEMKLTTNNKYDFVSHVMNEPYVTTDLTTGSMFSISRTSKDPARAMMVLNYLHTDPYVVNLIVNGIEDVHYKKVGDNRIEPIADSGYGTSGLFWVVGNQMINYLKPGQPEDLYTNWIKYNNEAKRSPLLGFVFNDSNVKNEVTQLTAIATEYKAITTGAIANPVKLLEERNKKLQDAGIEKVRAEIQTQADAWLAAQK
ncbi:ABC transporter substrate-binding protein [Paenibacillus sp. strain BS8-2]